jgi:hypothetical protein
MPRKLGITKAEVALPPELLSSRLTRGVSTTAAAR